MTDVTNITALMTLSQYSAKISPLIKDFNKFIKKNSKYFKRANYYGVVYFTYQQFIESETDRKSKYAPSEEYLNEQWQRDDWERVYDEVPAAIYAKYLEYQELFKLHFGKEHLSEIQSDETKSNKRSVRRAIDSDLYVNYLKDGIIAPSIIEEIFSSVGLKVPNNISKLKTKIEAQGYNRSIENKLLAKTKEFEDSLRKELAPYYEELKNIKKQRIMYFINKFETEYNSEKLYEFTRSFKITSVQSEVERIINDFFKGDYSKENYRQYIYTRLSNFDAILEKKAIAYAESFIQIFIQRIEEKLSVINNKLGSPVISFSNLCFGGGQLEGIVEVVWESGTKINIEAQIIIAGGVNIQTEHCRYLLKPFHNGKYVDLEDIDNQNF